MRLRPGDAKALIDRGIAYGKARAFDLAKADFDRALELRPDDPAVLSDRGLLLEHHGNLDAAIADLRRATALDPKLSSAWLNLAVAYGDARAFGPAVGAADEVLKLRPRDGAALTLRANARLALGDHAGAMADYDAAVAADPGDTTALYDRGVENAKAHRLDAAVADFEAVLRIAPDDEGARRRRDAALAERDGPPPAAPAAERRERAIAAMTEALRLDPRAAWALVRRARAYLDGGRAREALADFDAALLIEPDNAAARDGRTRAAAPAP